MVGSQRIPGRVQAQLQSPGGVATCLTDLSHITTTQTTMLMLPRLFNQLDRAKERETLAQECTEAWEKHLLDCAKEREMLAQECTKAWEKHLLNRIDAFAAVQSTLVKCLSMQDGALQELKVIATAQSTLLENCFSSVNTVLGWVQTVLEDCPRQSTLLEDPFFSVDAVLGWVQTILEDHFSAVNAVLGQVGTVLDTYATNWMVYTCNSLPLPLRTLWLMLPHAPPCHLSQHLLPIHPLQSTPHRLLSCHLPIIHRLWPPLFPLMLGSRMSISLYLAPRIPADGPNHNAHPNSTSIRETSSQMIAMWVLNSDNNNAVVNR
jgi:hypothetical protein